MHSLALRFGAHGGVIQPFGTGMSHPTFVCEMASPARALSKQKVSAGLRALVDEVLDSPMPQNPVHDPASEWNRQTIHRHLRRGSRTVAASLCTAGGDLVSPLTWSVRSPASAEGAASLTEQ